jgi:oxygen-independent coproporphyrinogen-3 oxidase
MEVSMKLKQIYDTGLLYHHYANTAYPLTPATFMEYRIKSQDEIHDFMVSEWKKTDQLSLYIHIPFCKIRCRFCEYTVLENPDEDLENLYVSLLLKEIEMYKEIVKDKKIVGYDMGGGTPTSLSLNNLRRITDAVNTSFSMKKNVVFSIETTPVIAAKEPEKIAAIYKMGYERISMGIQTVSEKLLNDLGREGTTHIYEVAAENIRKAGFKRFNVDIMYGFLHQSDVELENTLRYAISLNPEYITLYRNRYKGTKIESEAGGVSLYKVMKQYRLAYALLTEHGYLANVGKNTFSKVEGDYGTSDYLTRRVIEGTPYIGLGLGAQSFGMDYLAYNDGAANKKLERYQRKIEKHELPIQDIYKLPMEESIAKMVSVAFYFGFVDLVAFEKRFGISFLEKFKAEVAFVLNNGLMERIDNRIQLTDKGSDFINGVIPLFYSKHSQNELVALYEKNHDNQNDEKEFLSAYHQSDYDPLSLAADMAVFTIKNEESEDYRKLSEKVLSILLIKRGEHPYMNSWALPGGFVRHGETIEETAYRELREEAGVTDISLAQLHCFSEPGRDPRGCIISCSFMALASEDQFHLNAGDDAIDAAWFQVNYHLVSTEVKNVDKEQVVTKQYKLQLSNAENKLKAQIEVNSYLSAHRTKTEYRILVSQGIAFDHAKIIAYAVNQLRENLNTSMPMFELMPEYFTLTDLQHAYEAVLGEELLTANFRRKIADYVVETEKRVEGQGHRPSKLYKRNMEKL